MVHVAAEENALIAWCEFLGAVIYTDLHHAKGQIAESSTTIKRIKAADCTDVAHLSFCGRGDSYKGE